MALSLKVLKTSARSLRLNIVKNEIPYPIKAAQPIITTKLNQFFATNNDLIIINTKSRRTNTKVFLIIGILILIMLSAYLIIYNIFYISVSRDIRFYGLLKTIGTTNKQLKKIVRKQAEILCIIGIPIGLVLGFLLLFALVPLVMRTTTIQNFGVAPSPIVFIGSALFSFVTVMISLIKPCG